MTVRESQVEIDNIKEEAYSVQLKGNSKCTGYTIETQLAIIIRYGLRLSLLLWRLNQARFAILWDKTPQMGEVSMQLHANSSLALGISNSYL
jgi:hypothetical protein